MLIDLDLLADAVRALLGLALCIAGGAVIAIAVQILTTIEGE